MQVEIRLENYLVTIDGTFSKILWRTGQVYKNVKFFQRIEMIGENGNYSWEEELGYRSKTKSQSRGILNFPVGDAVRHMYQEFEILIGK